MKKLFIFLLMILFTCSVVMGQSDELNIDSLLATNQHDTLKARVLYDRAFLICTAKPDRAEALIEETLNLLPEIHNLRRSSYDVLAYVYQAKGDFPKAIGYFEKALSRIRRYPLLKGKRLKKREGMNLIMTAQIYTAWGKYKKSLNLLVDAENIFKQINQNTLIGHTLTLKADIYTRLGSYDIAQTNYLEVMTFFEKEKNKSNNQNALAVTYQQYGLLLRKLEKNKEALGYFEKSKNIFAEEKGYNYIATLDAIATTYISLKEYEKSEKVYKNITLLLKKESFPRLLPEIYSNQSELFFAMKQQDSANIYLQKAELLAKDGKDFENILSHIYNVYAKYRIEMKEFSEAIRYAEASIQISSKNGENDKKELSYKFSSRAYKGMGNYKKALHYHELYKSISDSLLNEKKQSVMLGNEVFFETGKRKQEIIKKEADNKLLKQEKASAEQETKIAIGGVALFAIFLVITLYFYRRAEQLKAEAERQKKIAEEKTKEVKSINESLKESTKEAKQLRDTLEHHIKNDKPIFERMTNFDLDRMLEDYKKGDKTLKKDFESLQNLSWAISELYDIILSKEKFDVHNMQKVIPRLCQILIARYEDKNITYEVSGNLSMLHGDAKRDLLELTVELIRNSVKYAFPNNREGLISIDVSRKGDNIDFTYRDNGIGYPEALQEGKGTQIIRNILNRYNTKPDVRNNEQGGVFVHFNYFPAKN